MKKLLIVISLLAIVEVLAQNSHPALYIFLTPESEAKSSVASDDAVVLETYFLDFSKSDRILYKLSMSSANVLNKNVTVKGGRSKLFVIKYLNEKGNNLPFIVSKKDIINSLTWEEIIYKTEPNNFAEILNAFKVVYLISAPSLAENYFIAKKVTIEEVPRM
ncbi:MAG TPA: hypothetical protein VGB50_12020 [Flavobacterium sp.]|jgi:hypothetical protein